MVHGPLLEHQLSDVVSQLVLVQMWAPCVVREVIGHKVVHSLFQVQVSGLQEKMQESDHRLEAINFDICLKKLWINESNKC